jgi:hypothetical protein
MHQHDDSFFSFLHYLTFINCPSLLTHDPAGCASQKHAIKLLNPVVKVWLAAI